MSQSFVAQNINGVLVEQWTGPGGRILRRVNDALCIFNRYGECVGEPSSLDLGLDYIQWDRREQIKLTVIKPKGEE